MRKPDSEKLGEDLSVAASWVENGLMSICMRQDSISRLPSFALYSLESGGKRVRPFLVRSACTAVGGHPDSALKAACAVEMIHTYSLIHDDLPAMDDDEMRRGKPALHMKSGAKQALLAGDLLLIEAFGELLDTPLGPGRVASMVKRLASAAGPGYLVGGQYMDMYHSSDAGADWIHTMILGKTAAMIRVSLELGACAGGANDDVFEAISAEGDRLGFLFQLTDDILDQCGNAEEMGKEVSKDTGKGKRNPVSMMGLDEAAKKAEEMASDIASRLMDIRGNWEKVADLALYLPLRRK
ncbi:MAG: polyprenyl synthetase family protein [Candidatus Aegiribacteria sp.]|nr:polyprenyl synthetase family protein [Candidatus Aegiribacteria sp.]